MQTPQWITKEIQELIKRTTHQDQVSFILGMKDGSVSTVLVIHHSKKSNQSHITISVNAEKAFNKGQQPFMIKPESGYKGNITQHKDHVHKCTINIRLNSEKMKHTF